MGYWSLEPWEKAQGAFEERASNVEDEILGVVSGLLDIRDCALGDEDIEPENERLYEFLVYATPVEARQKVLRCLSSIRQSEEAVYSECASLAAELESEKEESAKSLTEAEKEIREHVSTISDLECQIKDLESRYAEIQSALAEAQRENDELNRMISDSFGDAVAGNFQAARKLL